MQLGDFVFDLPVWVVNAQVGGSGGLLCCQVEGQDCLSIFTDENLIERYFENHQAPGQIVPVKIESPDTLATVLEGSFNTDLAAHVAFDPNGKAFVWPIANVLEKLRTNE